MIKKKPNDPFLTADDILAKRKEIKRDELQLEQISERLNQNRQLFAAMLTIVPPELRQQFLVDDAGCTAGDLFGASPVATAKKKSVFSATVMPMSPRTKNTRATNPQSFATALTEMVKNAGDQGITHRELIEKVKKTEFAEKGTKNSAKAYYNNVGKLFHRGLLVKHGELLFYKEIFDKLTKAGTLPPQQITTVTRGGAAQIAMDILRKYPGGLTSVELKKHIVAEPTAPKSIEKHGQYIYNILATLMGSGKVTRIGGIYRAAETARPRGNGASGAKASGPAR
jgi:hypothetical protein